MVAGHVIECGTQATGGNFSGFRSAASIPLSRWASRSPRSPPTGRRVITKHDGTGGAVTVDTVTAQLVYEIQSPALPRTRRDRRTSTRSRSATTGTDRVAVSGASGVAAARAAQGLRQRARRLPQQRGVRAHRPRHRGEGRVGPHPGRRPCCAASVRRASSGPGPHRPRGRRPPRRPPRACCAAWSRTPDPTRSERRSPRRGRARAGVVPRLHDDRAARPGHAVRRLPGGVRRPATVSHTVVHADGTVGGAPDAVPAEQGPARRLARRPPRTPSVPRSAGRGDHGGCRSAPSCTRAPATRAATPTSGCGVRTRRAYDGPGSPGCSPS